MTIRPFLYCPAVPLQVDLFWISLSPSYVFTCHQNLILSKKLGVLNEDGVLSWLVIRIKRLKYLQHAKYPNNKHEKILINTITVGMLRYCTNCPFHKSISNEDSKFCYSILNSLTKYCIFSLKAQIKIKKGMNVWWIIPNDDSNLNTSQSNS